MGHAGIPRADNVRLAEGELPHLPESFSGVIMHVDDHFATINCVQLRVFFGTDSISCPAETLLGLDAGEMVAFEVEVDEDGIPQVVNVELAADVDYHAFRVNPPTEQAPTVQAKT